MRNFLGKAKECKLRLVLYTFAGSSCKDNNKSCSGWAANGECTKNPGYMLVNCKKSCNKCGGGGGGGNIISVI